MTITYKKRSIKKARTKKKYLVIKNRHTREVKINGVLDEKEGG
uniref:Uncharacterized protein n=1 Tax=viral metagenome TaxID=1070528 RepID=A0A6C0E426_9ZZZZ